MRLRVLAVLPACVMALVLVMVAPASGAVQVSVQATGLDSPRAVAVLGDDVLVAEAGHGGDVCMPVPVFGTDCIGLTSQISRVDVPSGMHRPMVSGLFSSLLGGSEALGVDGIAVRGGQVLAILGEYPQQFESISCGPSMPADCAAVKAGALAEAGHLLTINPRTGNTKALASVGGFDFDFSAEIPRQEHDSNPYGVLSGGGDRAFVADAGTNTLDLVTDDGMVSVVHYFHFEPPAGSFPTDAVPTCAVRAAGTMWVADLSGQLFRIDGGLATQVAVNDSTGTPLLHHVTGCSDTPNGDGDKDENSASVIYLVNMWTTPTFPSPNTGSVVRFDAKSGTATLVASGLNFPNGVAAANAHTLYVSANSVCPAAGGPAECNFMGQTSGLLLKISL